MSCDQSDSCYSSSSESSLSKSSCSESYSSSCSKCNSSSSKDNCSCKSSSSSLSYIDSCSTYSTSESNSSSCRSKSEGCSSCGSSSDLSCSCNMKSSSSSCSKCSSGTGSCISSGSFSSCSSDSDSCSLSRSCESCSSSSSSECDKGHVFDLASAAMSFIPTEKACESADFVGSRVVARGYIYKGCTICNCNVDPFTKCGIAGGKPEYPKKVVGTYSLEYTIVNPEFNRALACLFSDYFCKYFELAERLRGRVLADATLTLSFSDSSDFFLPSVDTVVLSGRIPWGIKGERWTMAVTGGTGDYSKAQGEIEFTRLCVTNGSRSRLGESWRINLDPCTLIVKPTCQ